MNVIEHIDLLKENSSIGYNKNAFKLFTYILTQVDRNGSSYSVYLNDKTLMNKTRMLESDFNKAKEDLQNLEIVNCEKIKNGDISLYEINPLKRDSMKRYYSFWSYFWYLNGKDVISPVATKVYVTILSYTESFGGNERCLVNKRTLKNMSKLQIEDIENGLKELETRGLIMLFDYYYESEYEFFSIQLMKEEDNPEVFNLLYKVELMKNIGDISPESFVVYQSLVSNNPGNKLKSENLFPMEMLEENVCMDRTKIKDALSCLLEKMLISVRYSLDEGMIIYKVLF